MYVCCFLFAVLGARLLCCGARWGMGDKLGGGGPVLNPKSKRIQSCRATAALPPCCPVEFRAPPSTAAWLAGPGHPLSPAGWHLPKRPGFRRGTSGGSRLPYLTLRIGALTARLRKRKPGRASLCSVRHPSIDQSNPSMHTPPLPNHQSTIAQQVWPAWSFLVFCPMSILLPSSHHITSHCASHRIAAPLRRRLRISTCPSH